MPAPRIWIVTYGTNAATVRSAINADSPRDGKRPTSSCACVTNPNRRPSAATLGPIAYHGAMPRTP